ncbi:MAG: hypothetical protein LBU40_02995 [Methanobrevibacter sp.]|jgi:uridine kinase|nr:hypothetical protein [Methanobrevibacter sp.]
MANMETKITIDSNIFRVISQKAKNEGTTENKIINDILKKELKNSENSIEKVERLTNGKIKIANKNTYAINSSKTELNSIVGIIEAPEGFDVVEAEKDSRNRI